MEIYEIRGSSNLSVDKIYSIVPLKMDLNNLENYV